MSEMKRQTHGREPLYAPHVAIEEAQMISGLIPIRLFKVLFPLWDVEAVGLEESRRPYEMIEKYLLRAIDEGKLESSQNLADFFGLDIHIVDKTLKFLQSMGHVQKMDNSWIITQLGLNSVQTGEKYILVEKRYKLYFDSFHLQPLPRTHYHSHVFYEQDVEHALINHGFHRLFSMQSWQSSALTELEKRPDRATYNVPEELQNLSVPRVIRVYLPMYIMETRKPEGLTKAYYAVFTRVHGLRDTFFEHLVNTYSEVLTPLYNEGKLDEYKLWQDWLSHHGLSDAQLRQLPNGIWQVIVIPNMLRPSNGLSFSDIGTYQLKSGYFLHLWCNDIALRRMAALERALKAIRLRQETITQQILEELLQRLVVQLQTPPLNVTELREYAQEREEKEILQLLEKLE